MRPVRVELSLTTSQAAVLVELVNAAREGRPARVRLTVGAEQALGRLGAKLCDALGAVAEAVRCGEFDRVEKG